MFTDHFDKVFCLNLPIRKDRKKRIGDLFKKKEIEVEFFYGCRGFSVPFIHERVKERFSAAGYVGTLISYLNLFDYALSSGYEKICVVEDDVMIHNQINALADELLPMLPADCDMCYFSYIPLSEDHTMWNYRTINDRFVLGGPEKGIFKAKNLCSMMGLSINKKIMEHLLKRLNEDPRPIDEFIMAEVQDKDGFGVYGINPQFFCATDCDSDGCGSTIPNLTKRSMDIRASRIEDYIV